MAIDDSTMVIRSLGSATGKAPGVSLLLLARTKQMQRQWNRYWGIEWKADRGKRREDRGNGEG